MTENDYSPTASNEVAVIMLGELPGSDAAAARPLHDAIAADRETARRAAGNTSHLAVLSTALMGGTPGSLLSIDRWAPVNDDASASNVVDEGAEIFSLALVIERYHGRADWFSFGELPDPSASTDAWLIVVRGRLAGDPASAQAGHDAVASAGAPAMRQAGDIAHLSFTGVDDPTQFISIDVWNRDDLIETMYANPDVAAGFMALFVEPPTLTVYRTSDWQQW